MCSQTRWYQSKMSGTTCSAATGDDFGTVDEQTSVHDTGDDHSAGSRQGYSLSPSHSPSILNVTFSGDSLSSNSSLNRTLGDVPISWSPVHMENSVIISDPDANDSVLADLSGADDQLANDSVLADLSDADDQPANDSVLADLSDADDQSANDSVLADLSDADDQPANDSVLADLSDADDQPANNLLDELANDSPLSEEFNSISTPSSNLDTTLSPSQAPSQAYPTISIIQSRLPQGKKKKIILDD